MSDERKTVTIVCTHPNGVQLQLFKLAPHERYTVTLKGGRNEGIDEDFWKAWADENAGNALFVNGTISLLQE